MKHMVHSGKTTCAVFFSSATITESFIYYYGKLAGSWGKTIQPQKSLCPQHSSRSSRTEAVSWLPAESHLLKSVSHFFVNRNTQDTVLQDRCCLKKRLYSDQIGHCKSGHRVLWQWGWLLGLCWFVLNVAAMKQSENYVIMLINQLFRYQRSLTLIHSLCRLSNTLPLFVKQSETTQM